MATTDETRAECAERVRGPGKFEGEQIYVPYFYDQYLDGGADEDHGRTLQFNVTDEDRTIFPDELSGVNVVYIYERDDGFVCETDGPGDDDFEGSNDCC